MINKMVIPSIAFIVFVIFIIYSFNIKNRKLSYDLILDKQCSQQLKGIAILCVIIGHLCMGNFIKIPFLSFLGSQGVEVFLFVSGYGLVKSYNVNGISGRFLLKRIKKVFVPFFVITAVIILFNIMILKNYYSIKTIALWLFGLDISFDGSMWYISFILMWYVVFYIIYKLKIYNYIRIIFLICTSIAMFYLSLKSTPKSLNHEYISHCFMFPIGCFCATYSNIIYKYLLTKINVHKMIFMFKAISIISIFIVFPFGYILKKNLPFYLVCNLSFSVSIILIIMIMRYYSLRSSFLNYIGKISYEIYLIEEIFMYKYSVLNVCNVQIISIIVYMIFIVLLGSILNRILSVILNRNIILK